MKEGFDVDSVVHVAVSKATNFQFDIDSAGTGRQHNTEKPQFTIDANRSPPLEKKNANPNAQILFEADSSSFSERIDMWELGSTKKRRRN